MQIWKRFIGNDPVGLDTSNVVSLTMVNCSTLFLCDQLVSIRLFRWEMSAKQIKSKVRRHMYIKPSPAACPRSALSISKCIVKVLQFSCMGETQRKHYKWSAISSPVPFFKKNPQEQSFPCPQRSPCPASLLFAHMLVAEHARLQDSWRKLHYKLAPLPKSSQYFSILAEDPLNTRSTCFQYAAVHLLWFRSPRQGSSSLEHII